MYKLIRLSALLSSASIIFFLQFILYAFLFFFSSKAFCSIQNNAFYFEIKSTRFVPRGELFGHDKAIWSYDTKKIIPYSDLDIFISSHSLLPISGRIIDDRMPSCNLIQLVGGAKKLNSSLSINLSDFSTYSEGPQNNLLRLILIPNLSVLTENTKKQIITLAFFKDGQVCDVTDKVNWSLRPLYIYGGGQYKFMPKSVFFLLQARIGTFVSNYSTLQVLL